MCYANKVWNQGQTLYDDYGKMKLSAKNGIYIVNDTSVEIDGNLSLIGSPGSGSEKWTITAPIISVSDSIEAGVLDTAGFNGRLIIKGNLEDDRGEIEAGDFYARNNYRIFYWKDSTHPNETVQCIESNTPSNFGSPKGISGTQKTWLRFGSTSSYNCMAMPVNGSSIYFRVKSSSDSSYTWYNLKTDIIDKLGTGGGSQYADAAAASATEAKGYRDAASGYATTASQAATNANSYKNSASSYATSASSSASDAQSYMEQARDFAAGNTAIKAMEQQTTVSPNSTKTFSIVSGGLYLIVTQHASGGNASSSYIVQGGRSSSIPLYDGGDVKVTCSGTTVSVKHNGSTNTANIYITRLM